MSVFLGNRRPYAIDDHVSIHLVHGYELTDGVLKAFKARLSPCD
ncbi:MAG TPA: hypothetical protein VGH82_02490 [Gaiellaceae bacterium]